jgi:Bacterial PH domain
MVQKEHIPFLKDSEHIVMILHRHWIIFIFKILYIIFLVLSSILIIMIREEIMSFIGGGLFWGFMSLYWIFFLTFIFLSWVTDELDIFIITNERIIGIDQISALSRTVSECSIDRVQEVNAEVSGILQTIFSYGHVHIHTASEHSDMTISFAPNPVENARQINNVIHEFR